VSERKSPGKGTAQSKAKGAPAKAAPRAAAAAPPKPAPRPPAPPKAAPKPKPAPVAAAAGTVIPAPDGARKASFKRTLIGRVKSDKMNKTIVVEVVRSKLDPVYKKYVRVRKTYKAHDEENTCRIGDRVEIIEHRPLSKLKRWKLLNLVERAVQE
jgi:small subunit ribosomal protein S17